MAFDQQIDPNLDAELRAIHALYSALARDLDAECGLGGKLLFAGELNGDSSRLVRAANIAGAASLSATADSAAQRASIREGVIDFLVTSLDEALRILKNEIRKRNGVAVGVGVANSQVVSEMIERGVLPDLLAHNAGAECDDFIGQGARKIELLPEDSSRVFLIEQSEPAEFERRAMQLLPPEDHASRRWLRVSPRYLGPRARRLRSVACDAALAA